MWVQMHNISFGLMNRVYGETLEKTIGEIIKVDIDKDGAGWDHFLRVKILVDITKPLVRGNLINCSCNLLWITFKYEKLPNFCFICGIIKHHSSGCLISALNSKLHDKDQSQYGIWPKASISKGSKKSSSPQLLMAEKW